MDISHPQRNLDWKKVFKKILLKEEQLQDNSMTEAPTGSANFETKVVNEALCSYEQEHELSSEFSESESRLLQSVSSLSASTENLKVVEENKLTLEAPLDFNSDMSCSPPFNFRNRKNKNAPEWNKVFKEILGNKPSKTDLPEKSEPLLQTQDVNKPLPQKQDVRSKYGARKKPNRSVHGYKRDADEAKVRAQFASWTRVKPPQYEYNLNDLDGAGINIFKDRIKKDVLSSPIRSHSDDLKFFNLSKYSDRPYEKDVPLTGFVAVKRYTKADVRDISQIELSEAWDDDLLF